MSKRSLVVLIVIFAGVTEYSLREHSTGISAPRSSAAPQDSQPRIPITGIQILFTCNKVEAAMADEVVFGVALLNVGKDNAYIYDRLDWGEGAGLLLYVNDGKREGFIPWVDPPFPPPPSDDPGLFVRLGPGRLYGLREEWKVKDIVHGPGNFTFRVEYKSPVYRENVYDPKFKFPEHQYWFDFQGVKSNQLTFEVSP